MIHKINKRLNVETPLWNVLGTPTIQSDLFWYIREQITNRIYRFNIQIR